MLLKDSGQNDCPYSPLVNASWDAEQALQNFAVQEPANIDEEL